MIHFRGIAEVEEFLWLRLFRMECLRFYVKDHRVKSIFLSIFLFLRLLNFKIYLRVAPSVAK